MPQRWGSTDAPAQRGKVGEEPPCASGEPGPEPTCQQPCLIACPPPIPASALSSCRLQCWKSQSCKKSRGEGNAGHCWDSPCRQGSVCQGAWAVIVINVDTAGNGRAGASSKCTEAGNEPHQFLRCQLFHGAAAEMGRTGPCLLKQVLPTAGSWVQTHSSCAMGWPWLAACRERALGSWKWSQSSECLSKTVGDSGCSNIRPTG